MRVSIKVTAGPANGQSFGFEEPDCFLFGRAADARVSLPDDPYVSRQHFLLEVAPPNCKVTDLGSKNGLYVNGVRYGGRKPPGRGVKQAPNQATETHLRDGDEIAVGDTRMKVAIEADEEPTPQQLETMTHTPQPAKREVRCIRCNKEVTDEAGPRGQISDARYVCRSCRSKEQRAPIELVEVLLKAAAEARAAPDAPSFTGYRIVKELGRGGMGVVYQAIDESSGDAVAIKTMLPQVAADQQAVRTFQREVEVTRQLKHQNIVELLDHGDAEGTFFFVLEFVDGMDLERFIKHSGGRVVLTAAAPIMIGALDGLAHAHKRKVRVEIAGGDEKRFKGIVHRDLKPQNVLLARAGDRWIAKVADFGLSKSFESAGLTDMTVPGQVAGTPVYWPREQITHYKYLNPATDVFSIAAVFYEMLTGSWVREGFRELFARCQRRGVGPSISDFMRVIAGNRAVPIRERLDSIPAAVAEVIDRALGETEVPNDEARMRTMLGELRYPDAGAFKSALAKALEQAKVKL